MRWQALEYLFSPAGRFLDGSVLATRADGALLRGVRGPGPRDGAAVVGPAARRVPRVAQAGVAEVMEQEELGVLGEELPHL
jgi:hypothetical protein